MAEALLTTGQPPSLAQRAQQLQRICRGSWKGCSSLHPQQHLTLREAAYFTLSSFTRHEA